MKKIATIALVLIMTVTLLTGCNQATSISTEYDVPDNLCHLLTTQVYNIYWNDDEYAFEAYALDNTLLDTYVVGYQSIVDCYYVNGIACVMYINRDTSTRHYVVFDGNHLVEIYE